MAAERVENRKAHDPSLAQVATEVGRLIDAQADEGPDRHQHGTGEKWQPPPPAHELGVTESRQCKERGGTECHTEREADLHDTAVEAAPVCGRVLGRHQDRASPLAADRDALHQAAGNEQHRRSHSDRGITRQQAYQGRGDAHADQRQDQHRLAPQPIAEVAEHYRAQWPRHEADADSADRQEPSDARVVRREEQPVEHQGCRSGVDQEVVPLDGGADGARRDDGAHPGRLRFQGGCLLRWGRASD
jgi:hypothetical protein